MKGSIGLNLIASWGGFAVCIVVGVVLMPFTLTILGETRYGFWLFINAVAGYSGLLTLGLCTTISRYTAKYSAVGDWSSLNRLLSAILAIYAGVSAVVMLAACVIALAAPLFGDWQITSLLELRLVVLLMGLNVVATLAGGVFGGALAGVQRFDIVRGTTAACWILRLLLTLRFLREDWGLLTIAVINLVFTICESIGYVMISRRVIPKLNVGFRSPDWTILRECYSFSGYSLLENIAQRIVYATDTVVIGVLFGPATIVPYYIALRLCNDIREVLQQVHLVVMPRISSVHARSGDANVREIVVKSTGFSFLLSAGFLIGAWYFGQLLVETWIGKVYAQTQAILMILLATQVIAIPVGVLRSSLTGMGDVRRPALLVFGEAILNLVLSIVFAKIFGLIGVAYGTAASLILVEAFVLLPYACRRIGVSVVRLLEATTAPQAAPLMALLTYCIAVARFTNPVAGWLTILAIVGGGALSLGGIWAVIQLREADNSLLSFLMRTDATEGSA